jgi:hypothetical protein
MNTRQKPAAQARELSNECPAEARSASKGAIPGRALIYKGDCSCKILEDLCGVLRGLVMEVYCARTPQQKPPFWGWSAVKRKCETQISFLLQCSKQKFSCQESEILDWEGG